MIVLALFGGCLVNTELYERRLAELTADDTGGPDTDSRDTDVDDTDSGDTDSGDTDSGDTDSGDTDVPVTDADGDGYDAVAAGGDDCDDTDASVFPGAAETWADGFTDNDCDGEPGGGVLEYGGEVWVGENPGDQAGRRIGTLGDVDGDGLSEYLVGAVYESSSYASGGVVYLVPGGVPSGSLSEAHRILGGGENWFLPQVIVGAPDLDGDGVADVLTTATGAESFEGAAFLVSGARLAAEPELRLPDDAFASVRGDAPGELAGTGARFLGDVVGDGGAYLAVSSLFASTPSGESSGRVAIFDSAGLSSARCSDGAIVVDGPYAGAAMGNVVESAGDVDDDGTDDYFVTVDYGDLAYVIPGGVAAPRVPDDALFRLTGTGAGEIGAAHMLGDVDGDGRRDLALIYLDSEVRVFTALVGTPVRTLDEYSSRVRLGEDALGYDVLDLGDRDGDGRAETFVPAQWHSEYSSAFAAIVPGSELGFRDDIALTDMALGAVSVRPLGRFGYRVALSPDVDGDGGEDILMGGYSDAQGGVDAGAALAIPVPR